MAIRPSAMVVFYEEFADGYAESIITKAVVQGPSRAAAVSEGGEVQAGGVRLERMSHGAHVRRGAIIRVMDQFYEVIGYEPRPPYGFEVDVVCELLSEPPELLEPLTFGGARLTFGGEPLVGPSP